MAETKETVGNAAAMRGTSGVLKPCPNCGRTPCDTVRFEVASHRRSPNVLDNLVWYIVCDCGRTTPLMTYPYYAIKEWNKDERNG